MNKYLPEVLRNITDFKELLFSEQPELERLRAYINTICDEACAETAGIEGLARLEKSLGLTDHSGDLELRRFRVLSAMNNRVPYTMAWLRNKLKSVFGEGSADVQLDTQAYDVSIEVDSIYADTLNSLYEDLRRVIPANMSLTANVSATQSFEQYAAFAVHTADDIDL